ENDAWAMVQLGNVYFNGGRLRDAAREYRQALRRLPHYVHAEAGLARVEASEGRYVIAIRRLRGVVGRLPIPAYVLLLGGLHRAPAWHARRAPDLPPCDDRTVPGERTGPIVVPTGARRQPALLAVVGTRCEAGSPMKRLALLAVAVASLALPAQAAAHPLGNF